MFPAHVPGLLWDEDASLLEQHIISIAAAAPSPTASSHPPPSTGVPTLCSLRARLLHTHPPEPACRRETRGARVLCCLFVRRRPATHAPCPCPAFFRSSLPRRCLPPRRSQTGGPTDSPRQPKRYAAPVTRTCSHPTAQDAAHHRTQPQRPRHSGPRPDGRQAQGEAGPRRHAHRPRPGPQTQRSEPRPQTAEVLHRAAFRRGGAGAGKAVRRGCLWRPA